MIRAIAIIITLSITSAYAKSRDVSQDHKVRYCPKSDNWHFHCDDKKEEKEEDKPLVKKKLSEKKQIKPMDIIKQKRQDYENAHADFLLDPNDELKALKYLRARKKMLEDVSLAVAKEQEFKWKYGEFNYENTRPTSALGNKLYIAKRNNDIEEHIANIRKNYGLIYFFASWCHICHKFSPIVKNFTNNYQIPVSAISIDGGPDEYFKDYKIDSGQAQNFNITHTPTILLYNSKTNSSQIIGTGFVPINELKERIYLLTKENAKNAY